MISLAAQHQGPHDLVLGVGEEQPEGAEDAGGRRDQDIAHREGAGDLDAGQRAVAAERAQREVARVAAAVGGDRLDGAGHRRDRKHQDPVGGGLDRSAERRRDDAVEHVARALRVERDRAVAQLRRVEVAECQQRVGQRRALAAEPVTGRPRIRAGADRADGDVAELVDRDDAAAARTDLGDVDERELDRVAAALDELAREVDAGADLVLARPHGLAVLDDRRLRRRAAHVERDQLAASGEPAEVAAGHHPGGGAGLDEVRRLAPCRLGRERATARLHHLELGADAGLAEAVDERAEVARDRRPDVGVDDGRAGALVLADLGQDLGRARHVDAVADGLTDDLLDAPLVRVIGVGVEQRDRDCLDIVLADLLRDVANGVLVERGPGLAAWAGSLGDLVPEPPRARVAAGSGTGCRRAPESAAGASRARRGSPWSSRAPCAHRVPRAPCSRRPWRRGRRRRSRRP